jgi:hypothetical protein
MAPQQNQKNEGGWGNAFERVTLHLELLVVNICTGYFT